VALSQKAVIADRMAVQEVGKRTRFSALLRLIAGGASERIGIGELIDRFGDKSFGAAMLLFALPNVVPLPPGASTLFGLPLLLIAAQLALGRPAIWLPMSLRRRSISAALFSRLVDATRPYLRWAERLLRPRLGFLLSPPMTRLTGLACVLLAILIALPIPLANFLSGVAVAAFAFGLLRHDGIAILLGWLATAVSLAATALVSGAVWVAAKETAEWMVRLWGG
jgi:hypothetical protein